MEAELGTMHTLVREVIIIARIISVRKVKDMGKRPDRKNPGTAETHFCEGVTGGPSS